MMQKKQRMNLREALPLAGITVSTFIFCTSEFMPVALLTDIALSAEPDNAAVLTVRKAAHEALLAASGGKNLSETMWLRSEIAAMEAKLND